MGEGNRVLTYIQAYSSDIKNEMMLFVGKWMEMMSNILSEISHIQKYEYIMCFFHMQDLEIKKNRRDTEKRNKTPSMARGRQKRVMGSGWN